MFTCFLARFPCLSCYFGNAVAEIRNAAQELMHVFSLILSSRYQKIAEFGNRRANTIGNAGRDAEVAAREVRGKGGEKSKTGAESGGCSTSTREWNGVHDRGGHARSFRGTAQEGNGEESRVCRCESPG